MPFLILGSGTFYALSYPEPFISSAQLEDPEISKVLQWFEDGALVCPPEGKLSTASRDL